MSSDHNLDSRFGSMNLQNQSQHDQQQSQPAQQSASARFERFFNSGGSPPSSSSNGGNNNSVGQYSSGLPSSSSPAGGPFGSFGAHNHFNQNSMNGPIGSIGSQAGSNLKPNLLQQQPQPPASSNNNNQNNYGSYNSSSSASLRNKNSALRSGLPQNWNPDSPTLSNDHSNNNFGGGNGNQSNPGSRFLNHSNINSQPPPAPLGGGVGLNDDDIIPTAIVVKNIPFSVVQEQLLQIIEDLSIPMPYAFNYHYDQGQFRGLAFANFRSPEEADAVVAALNGFDVSGRKLRVEYKKVLQAGEKERIEKEKAIKRMQSMQLEKERERRRNDENAMGGVPPQPPMPDNIGGAGPGSYNSYGLPLHQQGGGYPQPSMGGAGTSYDAFAAASGANHSSISPDSHQHQQQQLSSQSSSHLPHYGNDRHPDVVPAPVPLTADTLRAVQTGPHGDSDQSLLQSGNGGGARSERSGGGATSVSKKEELDLNDASTLEIYSRVLLFKDDRMRDELSFSKSLSPLERRTVHLVSQKLGLFHYSRGEGDERFVVVCKNEAPQIGSQRPLRSQASTIGRSSRRTLNQSEGMGGIGNGMGGAGGSNNNFGYASNNGLLSPGGSGGMGSGAQTTGRAGLRMKKSAPDMKRNYGDISGRSSQSDAFGFGQPASTNNSSNSGLLSSPSSHSSLIGSRRSNTNLREGYSSTMGRRPQAGGVGGAAGLQSLFSSPFDVPPVPTLSPSHGDGSSSPIGQSPALLRQPRGPPTNHPGGSTEARNFAPRSRITVGSKTSTNSESHPNSLTVGAELHSQSSFDQALNNQGAQQQQQQQHQQQLGEMDVRSHEPLEI